MKTNPTRNLLLVSLLALAACRTSCRTTVATNPVALEGPAAIVQPSPDLIGDRKLATPE